MGAWPTLASMPHRVRASTAEGNAVVVGCGGAAGGGRIPSTVFVSDFGRGGCCCYFGRCCPSRTSVPVLLLCSSRWREAPALHRVHASTVEAIAVQPDWREMPMLPRVHCWAVDRTKECWIDRELDRRSRQEEKEERPGVLLSSSSLLMISQCLARFAWTLFHTGEKGNKSLLDN